MNDDPQLDHDDFEQTERGGLLWFIVTAVLIIIAVAGSLFSILRMLQKYFY